MRLEDNVAERLKIKSHRFGNPECDVYFLRWGGTHHPLEIGREDDEHAQRQDEWQTKTRQIECCGEIMFERRCSKEDDHYENKYDRRYERRDLKIICSGTTKENAVETIEPRTNPFGVLFQSKGKQHRKQCADETEGTDDRTDE